jgi:DNA-binding NtrC family response regulator
MESVWTMADLFEKLKKMQILLIDDDACIRHAMSLFFTAEGCSLSAASSAEAALEKLSRHNYDIILVDYNLPNMDGLQLLGQIQDSSAQVIKILITAYGSNEVVSVARGLGVHEVIEKPFTSEIIEHTLSRLLDQHHA